MDTATRRKTTAGKRYVTFTLDNEYYCLEIHSVRELMGMSEITRIPQTPDFIRGVINLRGQVVTIMDLRLKFGMPFRDYDKRTGIVVVETQMNDEKLVIGIVVDVVHEVIAIPEDGVKKVSYINARVKSEFIDGVAETPGGMRIVLNINRILSDTEFVLLKHGIA